MESEVKGVLEFDLSDPEQAADFEAAKTIRGMRKMIPQLLKGLFSLKLTDTQFVLEKTKSLALIHKQQEISDLCTSLLEEGK